MVKLLSILVQEVIHLQYNNNNDKQILKGILFLPDMVDKSELIINNLNI